MMKLFSRVKPSFILYGLWYPGLIISLLLMLALCIFTGVDFFRTFNYSALKSVIIWIICSLWYVLCIVNAYRIRKGRKTVVWKEEKKVLRMLNVFSAFLLPGLLIIFLFIAIAMGAPIGQALGGIIPCAIWILWGIYVVVGLRKNGISLEDFAKEGDSREEEGESGKEKDSKLFRFVTPSFALKYVYWPGLLGGFAAYLILAGFRGGFNVFLSPSGSNIKGFLWTLFGAFLYVWAIINIFRIRNGKRPLFRYSPRRAFHSINTRSAVDMPFALIGILWSMGTKWWTILCMILILLFMSWGIFVEVGCYKNHLVPDGFIKKGKIE